MIKKLLNKILSPKNAMSFKESMDLAEMPVVTFTQGEKKINFLLDTGSNNSIIDVTFLQGLKYELLNVNTNLYGLEGTNHQAQVCMLKCSYKDKEYEYPYVIQNMSEVFSKIKKETGVTIHGILGSKFFNTFKYVLDFDELIAYSKQ